jgi:Raf kinase inhibitor-like YbhB/YbcL family protein
LGRLGRPGGWCVRTAAGRGTGERGTGERGTGRRRTGGPGLRAVLLAGSLCLLSGCGLIGGPQALRQDAPDNMTVTSQMFDQGTIMARYTCHGAGKSPPIQWSPPPAGTKSLALVVDDAAAPITPRAYWIVFDISPVTRDMQAGALPTGARQAQNSIGRARYDPPCPVGGRHKYRFTIYALSAVLHQQDGTALKAAWTAIARDAIARGRLTAAAAP